MKKLSILVLLGIFCLPIYSQNVVKSFYELQKEFDSPQLSIRNKSDLKKMFKEENEKPVTEVEEKARYIYTRADKMELFIGIDPNSDYFGEEVGTVPDETSRSASEGKIAYTIEYTTTNGDSIKKAYTQNEIAQLRKESAEQGDPQLLPQLLKNYKELATVQSEAATFCLYAKNKGKKTKEIIIQTRFLGMFILVGLSGEWNTKQLTEILSDEESQGVLFSATKE